MRVNFAGLVFVVVVWLLGFVVVVLKGSDLVRVDSTPLCSQGWLLTLLLNY